MQPAAPMIGVLGGTFDPVHAGHLRLAIEAREALGLAEVRLIPLAHAVHRDQPETPAELRLAMLRAAVAGHEDLVPDDREMRRSGPSFTVDTLRSLRAEWPERDLCLLLGGDAFAGFADWRDPQTILELANLAVVQRPGHGVPGDPRLRVILDRHRSERLQPGRNGRIVLLGGTLLEIASSDIRRRVAEGRSIDFLTPPAVVDLIAQHALYRR